VITVGVDAAVVERRLAARMLRCPGCAGVLTGQGHRRERSVRRQDRWSGFVRAAADAAAVGPCMCCCRWWRCCGGRIWSG
jgi:hypothetical protein